MGTEHNIVYIAKLASGRTTVSGWYQTRLLSSTHLCLLVRKSVIADKVSSVFLRPAVRTGSVAGIDLFPVTLVSPFDVDAIGVIIRCRRCLAVVIDADRWDG